MTLVMDHSADTIAIETLDAMDAAALDALSFGVVGMNADGVVEVYNRAEAELAGLDLEWVMGAPFFETIAQCMNNFMVAQRYADEPELDATLPFVLTLRMRPTPVTLRLLQRPGARLHYLLLRR